MRVRILNLMCATKRGFTGTAQATGDPSQFLQAECGAGRAEVQQVRSDRSARRQLVVTATRSITAAKPAAATGWTINR